MSAPAHVTEAELGLAKPYLLEHKIPRLMENLAAQIVLAKPKDPLLFLQDQIHSLRKKRKVFFVLGGPGSGKGTQCERIAKTYDCVTVSTGDLLRAELKAGSDIGKKAEPFMKAGGIVPNEVMTPLLQKWIATVPETQSILIDGYPREIDQVVHFERDIVPASGVLYFQVSDKTMEQRCLKRGLTSGRSDDNMETIKKRIDAFHKQSVAVISFFSAQGVVQTFDAERPADAIWADVQKGLDSLLAKKSASLEPLYEEFLTRMEQNRKTNPMNLAAKYMTRELFCSFPKEQRDILYRCARSGADNSDSHVGCYILQPDNLVTYRAFFEPVIREYHKATATAKHVTDWDISHVGNGGILDVEKLGLSTLSMRVRVGRNLKRFNLPGNMNRAERIEFEKAMLQAFEQLKQNPAFGGKVYSLTPDFGTGTSNPNLITKEQYQKLIDDHIMFKDMAEDPYLRSAGIANDWPYGRGCYVSDDQQVILWFGEEDQLRIMCMKKGTKLNEVFERLHTVLDTVEKIPGMEFATDKDFGFLTSCPSNVGTGMRASVHVKIPNLTKDGTDTRAKEICKQFGLSVRGVGGEHTPIGADGTVDISPSARLFIRERDIIAKLYEGIACLMEEEKKASH